MSSSRAIPLLKAHVPPSAIRLIESVLNSGYLAEGETVEQLMDHLKTFVGNPNAIAVSDVSGALMLALHLSDVEPGDEVIVSPMCCLATTMPILNRFAHAVWCDVHADTGMMHAGSIGPLVSDKTKAVVFTHWSGDVAEVEEISQVAREHGLFVIEDASEALGAEVCGQRVGSLAADFTVFSFRAARHLTTGEGGALFCADPECAERAQWLKRYGIHQPSFRLPSGDLNPQSDILEGGYNHYMTNISAAIGLAQFAELDRRIQKHLENGLFFSEALARIPGIQILRRRKDARSAFWTYSLLAEERDRLQLKLKESGVGSQRLHLRNDLYSCFPNADRILPGVDRFDASTLSIPCGWWVSDTDRERIVAAIKSGW